MNVTRERIFLCIDYFDSELLKSKRTLLRPTLFIGAVIFSVLLMIVANLAPDALEKSWEHYTKMIFKYVDNIIQYIRNFIAMYINDIQKRKINTYRSIYVEDTFNEKGLDSKIICFGIYSFMTTALLTIFVCILALLNHLGINTIISVLEMGGITWLTSLPIIPIALFCAHNFKTVGALGIGIFGIYFSTYHGTRELLDI